MHNQMNPYGGVSPLIDKMIGNAYDIVKYVAKYLKEIRYVAENMQYVYTAANGSRIRMAATGTGAAQLVVPLPVDFPYDSIEALDVIAVYDGTQITPAGSTTFSYGIAGGNVVIDMASVNAAVRNADFRITATYSSGI